ncbi:MAG: class II fructose-bisphosphate aldolase [Micromonosporaceae bacterium]
MLENTGTLVGNAAAHRQAVAGFNVITIEHAEAIVAGAELAGRPVILQLSQNAVKFHGWRMGPIALASKAVAEAATVPVALHLDHVESEELLRQAPEYGFGSVMYDASTLPYDSNVAATKRAAEFAHAHGLWLESELGEVGGKDGAHAPGVRTDPDEAREFVAATGVDALAVAVGSSHAMTSQTATLDHALIRRLRDAVPVPLVLHGSSGVPDEELAVAVGAGMAKINIGTALNVAYTGAARAYLQANPQAVDPRKYLSPARDAVAELVAHYVKLLAPA